MSSTWAELVGTKQPAAKQSTQEPSLRALTLDGARDSRSQFDPDFDSSRGVINDPCEGDENADPLSREDQTTVAAPVTEEADHTRVTKPRECASPRRKRMLSVSQSDDSRQQSDVNSDVCGSKPPPKARQKVSLDGAWCDTRSKVSPDPPVSKDAHSDFSRFLLPSSDAAISMQSSSKPLSIISNLSNDAAAASQPRRRINSDDDHHHRPQSTVKEPDHSDDYKKYSFAAAVRASRDIAQSNPTCSSMNRSMISQSSDAEKKSSHQRGPRFQRIAEVKRADSVPQTPTLLSSQLSIERKSRRLRERYLDKDQQPSMESLSRLKKRVLSPPRSAARLRDLVKRARSLSATREIQSPRVLWGPPRMADDDLLLRSAREEERRAGGTGSLMLTPSNSTSQPRRARSTGGRARGRYLRRKVPITVKRMRTEKVPSVEQTPEASECESSMSITHELLDLPDFRQAELVNGANKDTSESATENESSRFSLSPNFNGCSSKGGGTALSSDVNSQTSMSVTPSDLPDCSSSELSSAMHANNHHRSSSSSMDRFQRDLREQLNGARDTRHGAGDEPMQSSMMPTIHPIDSCQTREECSVNDLESAVISSNNDGMPSVPVLIGGEPVTESISDIAGTSRVNGTVDSATTTPTELPSSMPSPNFITLQTELIFDTKTQCYFVKVPCPSDPTVSELRAVSEPISMPPLPGLLANISHPNPVAHPSSFSHQSSLTGSSTGIIGGGFPGLPSSLLGEALSKHPLQFPSASPVMSGGSLPLLGQSWPNGPPSVDALSVGSSSIPAVPSGPAPTSKPALGSPPCFSDFFSQQEYLSQVLNGLHHLTPPASESLGLASLPSASLDGSAAGKVGLNGANAAGVSAAASSAAVSVSRNHPMNLIKSGNNNNNNNVSKSHHTRGVWNHTSEDQLMTTCMQAASKLSNPSWADRLFPEEKARIRSERAREEDLLVRRKMAERRRDLEHARMLPRMTKVIERRGHNTDDTNRMMNDDSNNNNNGMQEWRVKVGGVDMKSTRIDGDSQQRRPKKTAVRIGGVRMNSSMDGCSHYHSQRRGHGYGANDDDDYYGGDSAAYSSRARRRVSKQHSRWQRKKEHSDSKETITVELSENRLKTRAKQIQKVKEKMGYQKYLLLVPKHRRVRYKHMDSPDIHQKISERRFRGQLTKFMNFIQQYKTAPVLCDLESTYEWKMANQPPQRQHYDHDRNDDKNEQSAKKEIEMNEDDRCDEEEKALEADHKEEEAMMVGGNDQSEECMVLPSSLLCDSSLMMTDKDDDDHNHEEPKKPIKSPTHHSLLQSSKDLMILSDFESKSDMGESGMIIAETSLVHCSSDSSSVAGTSPVGSSSLASTELTNVTLPSAAESLA